MGAGNTIVSGAIYSIPPRENGDGILSDHHPERSSETISVDEPTHPDRMTWSIESASSVRSQIAPSSIPSRCSCPLCNPRNDPSVQNAQTPRDAGLANRWARKDSNLRRHTPTDLQSVPFGHLGTRPVGKPSVASRQTESTPTPQPHRRVPSQISGRLHHQLEKSRPPESNR